MSLTDATQRQREAARPGDSVWLSANAGSGKTRVLTDRVARLLLEGADPASILCLTYTKAAAAEMQNRLFARLGAWALMPDVPLTQALTELGAQSLSARRLARARTLFAQAMEVPGGLRIQTIHAFCAGLLRRFPLESGVSPGFVELDDRSAALLRAAVVDGLALDPAGAAAIRGLGRYLGDDEGLAVLTAAIAGRAGDFTANPARIEPALGLPSEMTAAGLVAQVLLPGWRDAMLAWVPVLRTGGQTDANLADVLAQVASVAEPGLDELGLLVDGLVYKDGTKNPFGPKSDRLPTKALRNDHPALFAPLVELMERVADARDVRLAFIAAEKSQALHRFAALFLPAYAAAKAARGALDFDDLILRARALLSDPKVAQWVLYKLDGGLDHLLVDEAQDTAPAQWAVIERLTGAFGDDPQRPRSLFVVGDRKQSIYSFQGADPAAFDQMQAVFRDRLEPAGRGLLPLGLEWSFRSSPAILRAVDATFAEPAHRGLGATGPRHVAIHADMPGRVDLWPAIPTEPSPAAEDDWLAPVDRLGSRHAASRLAETLAAEIGRMLAQERLPERGSDGQWRSRPLRPRDILVLVRGRTNRLFPALMSALKGAGLPVAGADRMQLDHELAVRDIAALLRFLALPEDDLSLAEALKSPLFGWSEPDLYALAQPRPVGTTLWQALRGAADKHAATMAILDDLRGAADFERPYDLMNRLLIRHDGRRRLTARLGPEAEDAINALLAQALVYEQGQVPGLSGFLDWLDTDSVTIKRQLDDAGDMIRVMTVHAAKGRESPVVIVPMQLSDRATRTPALIGTDPPLWPVGKEQRPSAMAALFDARAEREEEEARRLLYVAMTRAERWLILCGAGSAKEMADTWPGLAQAGLQRAGAVDHAMPTGPGLRLAHADWDLPWGDAPPAAAVVAARHDWPPVPPAQTGAAPLSPTRLGGAKVLPGETDAEAAEIALARGRFLHLLLQHLPGLPEAEAMAAALALHAGAEDRDSIGDPAVLARDAVALLRAPHLAPLFAEGLAEVDLTAELGGVRLIGTVDRLIVSPAHVRIVDYKTNRLVPATAEAVPEGLLRQMGAYLAMAGQIWPDRPAEVAILWTATAELMPLPHALCMAALRRAAAA